MLKTDSIPRTPERPAEHYVAVVFGQPAFLEAAFARFKLQDGAGCSIVVSHRIYGNKVYAVTVEGGYSNTAMGQTILAACFINDFGAVFALGVLFATFNIWLAVFVAVMCVVLWFMPTWTRFIVLRFGATRVSEPERNSSFRPLFPRWPRPSGEERSGFALTSDWSAPLPSPLDVERSSSSACPGRPGVETARASIMRCRR